MTTLLDEIEGNRTRGAVAVAVVTMIGLALATVKVGNELQMTKEYARWANETARSATALETIAGMRPTVLILDKPEWAGGVGRVGKAAPRALKALPPFGVVCDNEVGWPRRDMIGVKCLERREPEAAR